MPQDPFSLGLRPLTSDPYGLGLRPLTPAPDPQRTTYGAPPPLPPEPDFRQKVLTTGARVLPALGGAAIGGMLGGPFGAAVGGFGGAGMGEIGGQYLEMQQGLRNNFNPNQVALQAGLGQLGGFVPVPAAGASLGQLGKYAGLNALEGGVINAASQVPTSIAETGELPSLGEMGSAFGYGGAFGAGFGSLPFVGRVAGLSNEAAPLAPKEANLPPPNPSLQFPPTSQYMQDWLNNARKNPQPVPGQLPGIENMGDLNAYTPQNAPERAWDPTTSPTPTGDPNQLDLNFSHYTTPGSKRAVPLQNLQNQDPNAFGGILGPTVGEIDLGQPPTMADFAPKSGGKEAQITRLEQMAYEAKQQGDTTTVREIEQEIEDLMAISTAPKTEYGGTGSPFEQYMRARSKGAQAPAPTLMEQMAPPSQQTLPKAPDNPFPGKATVSANGETVTLLRQDASVQNYFRSKGYVIAPNVVDQGLPVMVRADVMEKYNPSTPDAPRTPVSNAPKSPFTQSLTTPQVDLRAVRPGAVPEGRVPIQQGEGQEIPVPTDKVDDGLRKRMAESGFVETTTDPTTTVFQRNVAKAKEILARLLSNESGEFDPQALWEGVKGVGRKLNRGRKLLEESFWADPRDLYNIKSNDPYDMNATENPLDLSELLGTKPPSAPRMSADEDLIRRAKADPEFERKLRLTRSDLFERGRNLWNDESGEFDPQQLWANLRRFLGREPTPTEIDQVSSGQLSVQEVVAPTPGLAGALDNFIGTNGRFNNSVFSYDDIMHEIRNADDRVELERAYSSLSAGMSNADSNNVLQTYESLQNAVSRRLREVERIDQAAFGNVPSQAAVDAATPAVPSTSRVSPNQRNFMRALSEVIDSNDQGMGDPRSDGTYSAVVDVLDQVTTIEEMNKLMSTLDIYIGNTARDSPNRPILEDLKSEAQVNLMAIARGTGQPVAPPWERGPSIPHREGETPLPLDEAPQSARRYREMAGTAGSNPWDNYWQDPKNFEGGNAPRERPSSPSRPNEAPNLADPTQSRDLLGDDLKAPLTNAEVNDMRAYLAGRDKSDFKPDAQETEDWRGFARGMIEDAGDGPPGLRVQITGKYGGTQFFNLAYRGADGKTHAALTGSIEPNGKGSIDGLGSNEYVSREDRAVATATVLKKAIEMGARVPAGNFGNSKFTNRLIRNMVRNYDAQAKRLSASVPESILNDNTPIEQPYREVNPNANSDGGLPMARSRTDVNSPEFRGNYGQNAKDMFRRFITEEQGATPINPAANLNQAAGMWQNFKQKTGIGMGEPRPPKKEGDTNIVKEVIGGVNNITTAVDLSPGGRQAITMIHTPEFWKAMWASKNTIFSAKAEEAINADLKSLPTQTRQWNAQTLKFEDSIAERHNVAVIDGKTPIGKREEAIASQLVETGEFDKNGKTYRIPILSPVWKVAATPIRASNRFYRTFLNHLRANRFDNMMNYARDMAIDAEATGSARPGLLKQKYTPEQAQALNPFHNDVLAGELADYVNTATGRGPLKTHFWPSRGGEKSLESIADKLMYGLFSPRLMASRVRMMNPLTYAMATPYIRKQYMKSMLGAGMAWLTFTELGKMAGGEVSMDPTSSDAGKIRFEDTRFDPGSGFQQYLVVIARGLAGGYTSSASGEFHKYGEGFRGETQWEAGERFFANKLNPVAKFAYDLANASENIPFHVKDRAAQMFVPLAMQDLYEIMNERPDLLPWMVPVMFGMGTQTYSAGESVSKFYDPEDDWLVKGSIFENAPWNADR